MQFQQHTRQPIFIFTTSNSYKICTWYSPQFEIKSKNILNQDYIGKLFFIKRHVTTHSENKLLFCKKQTVYNGPIIFTGNLAIKITLIAGYGKGLLESETLYLPLYTLRLPLSYTITQYFIPIPLTLPNTLTLYPYPIRPQLIVSYTLTLIPYPYPHPNRIPLPLP